LDKLSKIGADGVRKEFASRGISEESLEKLLSFFNESASNDERLAIAKREIGDDTEGLSGINELEEILGKTKDIKNTEIKIDLSLVRGFDYYTGPIFEIRSNKESDLGSFAGGGRYDSLVSLYGGQQTPAVGISLGIERIFEIISRREGKDLTSAIDVFVACAQGSEELVRDVVGKLRDKGLACIYDLNKKNLGGQLEYANATATPYCLILFADNELKLKAMSTGEETIYKSLDEVIKKLLAKSK
jgi:histidyl-tRNA synthetase